MSAWPKTGAHEGVAFDLYRSCDITQADDWNSASGKSVSKSMIIDFAADPGMWKRSGKKKATAAMKGGSLFDCLLTTPQEFDSRYAVMDQWADFRTKAAQEWRDRMAADGVEVITADRLELAQQQIATVMIHEDAAKLIHGSRKQVAFRHTTKHPFGSKGLIDIVPDGDDETLVDIKTCEPSALESVRSIQRHIFEWGYHIQAGNYCQGWTFATGEERTKFKFIFISSKQPFTCAVVSLPLPAILFGADQYVAGMNRFAECLRLDHWPSIWDKTVEVDLPEYAYTEGNAK